MNSQNSSGRKFDSSHIYKSLRRYCTLFKEFQQKTEEKLIELTKDRDQTTCELNPNNTKLIYKCLDVLIVT